MVTNCVELPPACQSCPGRSAPGHAPHPQTLEGSTSKKGKRTNWTAFAAAYPKPWCLGLARCVSGVLNYRVSVWFQSCLDRNREWRAAHGNTRLSKPWLHLEPGLATGGCTLSANSQDIYRRKLDKLGRNLCLRTGAPFRVLICDCPKTACAKTGKYLEYGFRTKTLGKSFAGSLISAIKWLLHTLDLAASIQPIVFPGMALLRPIFGDWKNCEPGNFRPPVSKEVTLAAAVFVFVMHPQPGKYIIALLWLLGFHSLLRPMDMVVLTWADVVVWDRREPGMAPGVLFLSNPKGRRSGGPRVEHVLIEDDGLGRFCTEVKGLIPNSLLHRGLWPDTATALSKIWAHVMGHLEISHVGLCLLGLRAAGATWHYLTYGSIDRVQWRGRWRYSTTLTH